VKHCYEIPKMRGGEANNIEGGEVNEKRRKKKYESEKMSFHIFMEKGLLHYVPRLVEPKISSFTHV
jgi:hypothetical protein